MDLESEMDPINPDGEKGCGCIHCTRGKLLPLMIGATLGCIFCVVIVIWAAVFGLPGSQPRDVGYELNPTPTTSMFTPGYFLEAEQPVKLRQTLYIGVLTLEKYINTRAVSCNRTWGQNPRISKLEYFADTDQTNDLQLPIISLAAAGSKPDPYHSRKSFRMLQSVCERHVDSFDWFVRAVDDIYLRTDQLLEFLATADKDAQTLLGHSTFPVDDLAYTALQGGMYCLGGAGLVFSRPLLKALCPHLPACEQRFHQGPGDVELARCMKEYLGVECQDSPQNRQHFFHSHEFNPLTNMERFLAQKEAFSLHPVKSSWMMDLLHQHSLKREITAQSKTLQTQIQYRRHLLEQFADNSQSITSSVTRSVESEDESVTLFTASNTTYNARHCSAVNDVSTSQRIEIAEAVRRANFSCRLGDSLICPRLLSGYMQKLNKRSIFEVDLLCYNSTGQHVVSKVKLSKTLGAPQMKKFRKRPMPSDLVLLVTSRYGDPQLLDFLLLVKELSEQNQMELTVFLMLLKDRGTSTHKHSKAAEPDMYTVKELKNWYNQAKYVNLKTHVVNHDIDPLNSFTDVVNHIQSNHSNSVVMVTSPNVAFDVDFVKKCKIIARAGSHIYEPFPRKQILPVAHRQSRNANSSIMFDVLWTDSGRPVCIHASDLQNYRLTDKRELKLGSIRPKRLKAMNIIDLGLRVNDV